MNYVVSLLGELQIEPALGLESVAVLNHEFETTRLLVQEPETWTPIRLRIAEDGENLVLDEEPQQPSIEGWGEYGWVAEQLAFVARTIALRGSVVAGLLYRRGDHRDDISVLHVKGVSVCEHQATYLPEGRLVTAPRQRMTVEPGEFWIDEGDL